ncbi:MAG: hypothetical protein WKF37_05910 [Bryobacteraceae bacterium]
MSVRKSNVDSLLDAIKRKAPAQEPQVLSHSREKASLQSESSVPVVAGRPKKSRRAGRPVQFWMHDEDLRILRELAAWLAGQGVRASDSLVVRTALRSAKTGSELLQTFHEAAQLDGRLKDV